MLLLVLVPFTLPHRGKHFSFIPVHIYAGSCLNVKCQTVAFCVFFTVTPLVQLSSALKALQT